MQRISDMFLGGAGALILAAAFVAGVSDAADPLLREFFADDRGALRKYSRAVVTEGGRTVWLAGQTTLEDSSGKAIAGDFEAQLREDLRFIGEHLARFGGSVGDIVTMTAYVTDVSNADRYVAIKEEVFGAGPYPSSAFIGVSGFSRPGVVVEIKAVAVVGDKAQ